MTIHHFPYPWDGFLFLPCVLLSQTLAVWSSKTPTVFVRLASHLREWWGTAIKLAKSLYYSSVVCSGTIYAHTQMYSVVRQVTSSYSRANTRKISYLAILSTFILTVAATFLSQIIPESLLPFCIIMHWLSMCWIKLTSTFSFKDVFVFYGIVFAAFIPLMDWNIGSVLRCASCRPQTQPSWPNFLCVGAFSHL